MHDEELGAVGVGSSVGHGYGTAGIIACKLFVVESVSRAAGTVSLRIAALDHEAGDNAMEFCVVVEAFFGEENEVVGCNGSIGSVKFQVHGAFGGVDDCGVGFGWVDLEFWWG